MKFILLMQDALKIPVVDMEIPTVKVTGVPLDRWCLTKEYGRSSTSQVTVSLTV